MLVLAHASLTFQNAQAFTWLINVTFPKVPLPDSCLQGSCRQAPGTRVAKARDERGLLSVCVISLTPFPTKTKLPTGQNVPGPFGSVPSRAAS